jgi:hypothetical protein
MLFVLPGMALWALLPLIANRRLGLGPPDMAPCSALRSRCNFAVLILGRLRSRLTTNGLLTSALIFSAALVIIARPEFPCRARHSGFAGLA